ncbi:MAG: hypothetical protein ACTSRC_13095 [Candidatus Helarchaeota archaeon]
MFFWLIIGLIIGFFILMYLGLPIIWRLWAPTLNAAYKPSDLDLIAQPHPDQVQDNIPKVNVDESGKYEISFGQGRRFYNGTLQIHYENQWYFAHGSDDNPSLKLTAVKRDTGSDNLGSFHMTIMKWELKNSKIPVHSVIYSYPNQPFIKFQIIFPEGMKNVAIHDFSTLIFKYPCFELEGPNQRVLVYRYGFFSPPARKIPPRGTQGPAVFYDNELNTATFGPMDHFMLAFTKRDEMIFHGFEGNIKEIPKDYEHSTLLLFSQGINKSIIEWCSLLHKHHNTTPKDPYDDPVVANLGFWTNNGAYYYYRKEKGMSYEQTIAYIREVCKERDIPFKYYQLDSWWYQKDMKAFWKYPPFHFLGRLIGGGAFGGTLLWDTLPEEFPHGLKALYERIKTPFACHNRWFSPKSPYVQKYKSVLAKKAALPIEPKFWDDLMKESAEKGIIMYEQDWLKNTFTRIPSLQEDVNSVEDWLTWMAEAAHKNNITIQYCMAPSGAFLQAIKLAAVTNVRVTGDYHARATKRFFYPDFSQTNILVWGIGIWPSLDVYYTTTTPLWKGLYREKYPEQMTLLSNLGGGLICPGDKIERVNKELLLKTCNNEGLLLKPDRPITANDIMFKINQKPYIMDTWTQKENLFWRYVMVVNLWPRRVKDPSITLRELGYEDTGVLYDFLSTEMHEIGPTDPIDLHLKRMDYKYFVFAPFLNEGIALIGSPEKFVTCANKLISNIECESSKLTFSVSYSPNSILTLLIYTKITPREVKIDDPSGSVSWDYFPSVNRLEITLKFLENNSNEISVIFAEQN